MARKLVELNRIMLIDDDNGFLPFKQLLIQVIASELDSFAITIKSVDAIDLSFFNGSVIRGP